MQNKVGGISETDTPLTQPRSGFDLEDTRRQLIALRVKHGANSPIGHRCSNIVELIQSADSATGDTHMHCIRNIQKQMAGIQRLLQASQ